MSLYFELEKDFEKHVPSFHIVLSTIVQGVH